MKTLAATPTSADNSYDRVTRAAWAHSVRYWVRLAAAARQTPLYQHTEDECRANARRCLRMYKACATP